jgi:hypothetical protein
LFLAIEAFQIIKFTKENMMQILSKPSQNSPNFLFSGKNLLVSGFFLWTLILSLTTLQVQHSCSPMLHWSNTPLPEYCSKSSSTESGDLTVAAGVTAGIVAVILEAPFIVAAGAGALAWFIAKKTFG